MIMLKRFSKKLLVLFIATFFSFVFYSSRCEVSADYYIDYGDPVPDSLVQLYHTINTGKGVEVSPAWRDWFNVNEKQIGAEIVPGTTHFYFDRVLDIQSSWAPRSTLISATFEKSSGYKIENSLTTTSSVTVGGEATIGVAAGIPGAVASADLSSQVQFTRSEELKYSSTFSYNFTESFTYLVPDDIPANYGIAWASVGDYFEAQYRCFRREYTRFWGDYEDSQQQYGTVRYITFQYNTLIVSDGNFEHMIHRPTY